MEALILRYEGLCRKAAGQSHLTPLGEDALSAARESFLHAVREYDAARGVPFPGFAKAKVYGDLRTLFKKARRQWQREVLPKGAEEGNVFDAVPDERDEMKNFEANETFQKMLAPLPEKPRKLLTMLYANGLTQKEAAAKQSTGLFRYRVFFRLSSSKFSRRSDATPSRAFSRQSKKSLDRGTT